MNTDTANGAVSNRVSKSLRDILQRMVRLESRVTSFMRYNGFRPGVDLEAERVYRVFVDHERAELHVTSPDVSIGYILDAALEVDDPRQSLRLFVSGVACGVIEPSEPIDKEGSK